MNNEKMSKIIYQRRKEKQLTQRQLAELLGVSDKTISKWECAGGAPDISFLESLSKVLEIDIETLLTGETDENDQIGGNMKKAKYYMCKECKNMIMSMNDVKLTCCGKVLAPLELRKATEEERLSVETIENEWYISSDHPMVKEDYIEWVAFAKAERIEIIKQYPEWDLSLRIFKKGHGMLIWYSEKKGGLYQYL